MSDYSDDSTEIHVRHQHRQRSPYRRPPPGGPHFIQTEVPRAPPTGYYQPAPFGRGLERTSIVVARSRSRERRSPPVRLAQPPPPPPPPTPPPRPPRRERIQERVRYRREYDYISDASNDDGFSTVYSFTPRSATRSHSTHSWNSEDDDSAPPADKVEKEAAPVRERYPTTSYVFESSYTGDGLIRGGHSAKLTSVVGTRVPSQPLFRWIHLTRPSMSFDEFSQEASRVPDLTGSERKGVSEILARIRRKYVKSVATASGRSVLHMEPSCLQQILKQERTSKTGVTSPRAVTWICLPYFSLENYSGLASDKNQTGFPIQTLLQARVSRATRERDLQQAVCQIKETPSGHCFHIAQFWCLVVDNSFILTYAKLTEATLRGDLISQTAKTIQELSGSLSRARLSVSYQGSVLWSIPVDECQTWPGLLSHFRDFWPMQLTFFHNKRLVTEQDWPRIWHMARRVNTRVVLDLRPGLGQKPPPQGVLNPLDDLIDDSKQKEPTLQSSDGDPGTSKSATEKLSPEWKAKLSAKMESTNHDRGFHIFTCLHGVSDGDPASINASALDDQLLEVEDFLLSMTSFADRRAYRDCPDTSRSSLYRLLKDRGSMLANIPASSLNTNKEQKGYEDHIDIFNAADVVYRFFFPPTVNVSTVGKYWGAVKTIVQSPIPDKEEPDDGITAQTSIRNTSFIRAALRDMTVDIANFGHIFGKAGRDERQRITVPTQFIRAWLHLVMALVYLPRDFHKSGRLLSVARSLIGDGLREIVRSMSEKPLLEQSVVLPLEIASLISMKLLQDITPGLPDICETYWSYLDTLESEVATRRSDRSLEARLGLLTQETSIIEEIIQAQSTIFRTLLTSTQALSVPGTTAETVEMATTRTASKPRQDARSPAPQYHSRSRSSPQPVYVNERTHYSERTRHPSARHYSAARRDYYDDYDNDDDDFVAMSDPSTIFKLAPTDPGGFRQLFLNDCLLQLDAREREIFEMRIQVSQLQGVNSNKVETTKDRQERAIYAFTIVTIVFLPLSAIATIFPLNTADNFWLYWATAVPVTAIVIFIGLLWTGELGNLLAWLMSLRTKKAGYEVLPDEWTYDRQQRRMKRYYYMGETRYLQP